VTLIFHPLAEREFIAAARLYETRALGLGADFIRQVERTLAEIVARPNAGSLYAGNTIRRRFIQRFPFAVVYEVKAESISVIAVMHLRRRPGYWKRRRPSGSTSRR
jgi:plasmid stabilization system protein ParE